MQEKYWRVENGKVMEVWIGREDSGEGWVFELDEPVPISESGSIIGKLKAAVRLVKSIEARPIEISMAGLPADRTIPSDRLLGYVSKVPIDSAVVAHLKGGLPKDRPIKVADVKAALAGIGTASGKTKSYAYLRHLRESGGLTAEGILKEGR